MLSETLKANLGDAILTVQQILNQKFTNHRNQNPRLVNFPIFVISLTHDTLMPGQEHINIWLYPISQ